MAIFSVIIPTYNRSALLREALDSVFSQTFPEYEIIVVDDGSTDDTIAVISSYGDRIRFYSQANLGPGEARNLGVHNALGKYVAFLDSDDVWFPWTLASYYEVIQRCGSPSFIAGSCRRFTHLDELKAVQKSGLQNNTYSDYYAAWQSNVNIVGCGVVVKTAAIAGTSGFFKGLVNAEDSDMWMKLGIVAGFVQMTDPIVLGYRQSSINVSKVGFKTIAGIRQMVALEKTGRYPGAKVRRRERWQILTRHIRPASIACLKEGNRADAWWLYRQSLWWHISVGRVRYGVGMPFLILKQLLTNSYAKLS